MEAGERFYGVRRRVIFDPYHCCGANDSTAGDERALAHCAAQIIHHVLRAVTLAARFDDAHEVRHLGLP